MRVNIPMAQWKQSIRAIAFCPGRVPRRRLPWRWRRLSGCSTLDENVIHRGYVFDKQTIAQVRPGMPAEQVLILLGTPTTTSTVGGDAWYYISQRSSA